MSTRLLLCSDLDRTLLPNGQQPESPGARERFTRFVPRPEVNLVYVTGRHRQLVEQAIRLPITVCRGLILSSAMWVPRSSR